MARISKRVRFSNPKGLQLSGIVEVPPGQTIGHCVFAHCFTCGKDLKAIVRVSRHLAELGFSVLRFDFSGLGNSEGAFRDTTFDDNCEDLRAAINWTREEGHPCQILIGHSLGGAAAMFVASEFPEIKGLATLASPSDTFHLAEFLARTNPLIESDGAGDVNIGGRDFTITDQMLKVLREIKLEPKIRGLSVPNLVLHSPSDETLHMKHAIQLFEWSGGPTSLLNLEDSDHLLLRHPKDVAYVARMIANWSERILTGLDSPNF